MNNDAIKLFIEKKARILKILIIRDHIINNLSGADYSKIEEINEINEAFSQKPDWQKITLIYNKLGPSTSAIGSGGAASRRKVSKAGSSRK